MITQLLVTLTETLQNQNVIIGILVSALGLGMAFIAKRITMAVRQTSKVKDGDTVYLTLMAFALVLILVGLIITILR
ncbi:MAG: hypothetical protein IKA31_03285 [Clostridia bacterium]|nr:hypothetical protein [Clostridia bacterium]